MCVLIGMVHCTGITRVQEDDVIRFNKIKLDETIVFKEALSSKAHSNHGLEPLCLQSTRAF